MSAKQRIIPVAEVDAGFSLLKDIIQIMQNPEGLNAAHEEARQQAALTEEKQKEFADANATISQAQQLTANLKKREDAIVTGETNHLTITNQFEQHKKSEELRLSNWEIDLKNKANGISADRQQIITDQKKLEDDRANMEAEYKRKVAAVDAEYAEITRSKNTLTQQANELNKVKETQEKRDQEMIRLVTGK